MPLKENFVHKQKSSNCQRDRSEAKKLFLSCPDALELWKEVKKEGRFSIQCTEIKSKSTANVDVSKRVIRISEDEAKFSVVDNMLFELNNLKRHKAFSSISKTGCKQGMDEYAHAMDEYAHAIERIEYDSVKDSNQIGASCVRSGFWSGMSVPFEEEMSGQYPESDWRTFEGNLKTQEKLGHTDTYRSQWKKECGHAAYLEKYSAISEKKINPWIRGEITLSEKERQEMMNELEALKKEYEIV